MSKSSEYYTDYKYERRQNNKKRAMEHLGNKCNYCGRTDALEFDHVDPTKKKYGISEILTRSWNLLLEELDKCQLLCESCHIKKTKEERISRAEHGTYACYKKGCSCDDCLDANNEYQREYRARKKMA